MEDYWSEFITVKNKYYCSEEDVYSRSPDDDAEDLFVEAVLSDRLAADREVTETELTNSRLYLTLTEKQRAQLIRRSHERNITLRQKRLKVKSQKPDLWSVFSGTDNSSTGTHSRSATPDSLDSLSPPRTPPGPKDPKDFWVADSSPLSRSRASLDSGHHSLINSPSSPFIPPTCVTVVPPQQILLHPPSKSVSPPRGGFSKKDKKQSLGKRFSASNVTQNRSHFGDEEFDRPPHDRSESRIYRPTSLDVLSSSDRTRPDDDDESRTLKAPPVGVHRQRSYVKDISKDLRQYYAHRAAVYEVQPQSFVLESSEGPHVKGIRYKPIGSIHLAQQKSVDRRIPFESNQNINQKDHWSSSRSSISNKQDQRDPFDLDSRKAVVDLRSVTPSSSSEEEKDVSINSSEGRKKSADFGFKVLARNEEDGFPNVVIESGRSGRTEIDWLHEDDIAKLRSLALLELDIVFSENQIQHSWRKRAKKHKLKRAENGVFGASLEALHKKDLIYFSDAPFVESTAPQILQKLVSHLEMKGVRDEGILRIPGNRAKTDEIRRCLDENFYERNHEADVALCGASANDVAALFKLFLRELPQPLLTHSLAPAFYKTHKIEDLGERLLALSMLVILLPSVYRYTLRKILDLCAKIVGHEKSNKMGLYNVAMIVAPNVFLPSLQPKGKGYVSSWVEPKDQQLNSEMDYARVTTELMQIMIKYRMILWTVPFRLIAQVRHQYESSPRSNGHTRPLHKLLGRKSKDIIQRPINNEVDYQNGVMRVSAPQFNKFHHPIKLDWRVTAKDMLARFIEDQAAKNERPTRVSGRREQKDSMRIQSSNSGSPSRAPPILPDLTTCLLRGSLKHALGTHALHERGGNIFEKRIDHSAHLIAVYQDNPNGEFVVKCLHPGGYSEL